jgi:hypothetical protein
MPRATTHSMTVTCWTADALPSDVPLRAGTFSGHRRQPAAHALPAQN